MFCIALCIVYTYLYYICHILTADMVQHRFMSMKQTFMSNLRKERESKARCSGKNPEEMYKPKWALFESAY